MRGQHQFTASSVEDQNLVHGGTGVEDDGPGWLGSTKANTRWTGSPTRLAAPRAVGRTDEWASNTFASESRS